MSPPFSQAHSVCQHGPTDVTHSTQTYDDPHTLPVNREHKTFVSSLAQTEGIIDPLPTSNALSVVSPNTTPTMSLNCTDNEIADTSVMPNLSPLNTPSDLSPLREEYREADHYSDTSQEDSAPNEGKSCSLTDVSEDTELSPHYQLGIDDSNTEQFEGRDTAEQSEKADKLDSQSSPSPVTIAEHSMQTDLIRTVSPEITLGDATTSTATTGSRGQPLSEIQQPPVVTKPLPKQNYSQFQQMPNFFMPPAELEESMRRLRASALNRPVPRTKAQQENRATRSPGGTHTVHTLREVQQYLNSRKFERLSSEAKPNVSTHETQRIARIFSSMSTPALSPSKN